MPLIELPVIITKEIAADPGRLAKAIMMNLDHLIGEASYTKNKVENGGDELNAVVEEKVKDIVREETDVDEVLNEAGVGNPDGNAPTAAPGALTVTPGINYDLWLSWGAIQNNSSVHYAVERKVTSGGTWTEIGVTTAVPGDPEGRWQYIDTGLSMNTNYYYRVRAKDGDGYGPYSAEVGPFQVAKALSEQIADLAITETKIDSNSISTPKIQANAIVGSKILAGEIATGHMQANSINGDRITGNTISALKIIAGDITAREIKANAITADQLDANAITAKHTITGAIIRTADPGNNRIVLKEGTGLGGSLADETINWKNTSNNVKGSIGMIGNTMYIDASDHVEVDANLDVGGHLYVNGEFHHLGTATSYFNGALSVNGYVYGTRVIVGTVAANPPNTGEASIYKDGLDIKARDSSGRVAVLGTLV